MPSTVAPTVKPFEMAREMPKQQTLSRQNYSTYPNDFYAITNKIKADNKQKILDGEDKSGKNWLDTGVNLLGSTLEGFAGFTEGIGDTLQYGLSTGANLVGLKGASKALKENADFDATGSLFGRSKEANIASDQWLDKARQKSYAPEVVAGVGNTFGQVAGAAGLGYAAGTATGLGGAGELTAAQQKAQMGINAASAFTSSYGNTKSELRRAGYDDKTATEKAFVSGMSEAISEQFFDGIPGLRSAGWADNVVDKVGKGVGKYFGTKTGKIAMKMLENTGEGFEEVLSNMFNSIGDNIIGKFDKNYAFKNANVLKDTFSKDSLDNFIMATISTALMNGSAGAINSYQRNQLIRAYAKDNGISVQEAKNVLMPTQEVTQEQPVDIVEESQTQEQPVDVVDEQSIQQPTQEQPQATENEAPVDVIEETRPITQETQNEVQEQVKEPIQEQPKTQEVYQEGRYKNLTEKDRKSMDEIFAKQRRGEELNKQDKDTLQYLQRKNKGLKNPELKIINKFEDFSKDHYAIKKEEFKNFDTTALDNAEKAIQANKSGRRTKQQWLDIAENIGSQLDNVDSDSLKKYAIESFLYAQPNQKQNLNRQSQGYVDFKEEEWVNAVYKGAKVGQKVQQEIKQKTQQVKEPNIAEQRKENVLEIPKEKVVQTGKEGEQFFEKQGAPKEVAKILSERPREPKKESAKEGIREAWEYVKRNVVDKGNTVYNLSRKTKNRELYSRYDKMGTSTGEAQYQIGDAQTNLEGKEYKNFKDENGEKVGLSLNGIWEMSEKAGISDDVMNEYLAHQLNTDVYGKPTASSQRELNSIMDQVEAGFLTAEEAEQAIKTSEKIQNVFGESMTKEDSLKRIKEIEKEYPNIKKYAQNVWQYGYNMLDNMVDAGLISKTEAQKFKKETPHYVRLQRNVEEQTKKGNELYELNGNEDVKVKNAVQERKGGTQDIFPFKDSMAEYTMQMTNAIRQNKFGQELSKTLKTAIDSQENNGIIDETGVTYGDILKKNDNGTYTFKIFENGKPKQLTINEGLYEALKPSEKYKWEKLTQPTLGRISNLQRTLLTDKNPLFLVTNAIKDIGDAPLNSKYGIAEFYKNYGRAIKEVTTNGELYKQYKALGGNQNTYFNFDEGFSNKTSKLEKLTAPIEKANTMIEQLPRMAEFITSLEHGASVDEAMYNAAEITTNFKRGGNWAKAANRNGATFLNASIQGFDKQIRNFKEIESPKQATKLLIKALVLGVAPALINDFAYDDDEEYQELQDYQKDNYYLFKGKNGEWIRIPKGRAISVFQNAARRAKYRLSGDKDAFSGFAQNISNQIAPNNPLEENVLAPIFAVKNNKSWSGSPIVNSYMEKRPNAEQYNEKTDELSKWLGEKLNYSPAKINYLLDQYTGGIGDVVLPQITSKSTSKTDNPITKPFLDKFTTDAVNSNKSVTNFYDTKTELEKKRNSVKATGEDIVRNSYMNTQNTTISDLYKQQREIQMDNSLSKKEKYSKAREIQREINKVAKESVENTKKIENNDTYMKIGDSYYYKYANDDGTTTYRKDSAKNIPTDKYALADYYREKVEKRAKKVGEKK